MGVSSPSIGYDGYIASDDIIVQDPTEYSIFSGTGYTTKITGEILSDLSNVSNLRFKMSLKHSSIGHTVYVRIYIGNELIWEKIYTAADTIYHTFTNDIMVTWYRADELKVKCQTTANTGYMKDFQICGKISPVRLD